MSSCHVSYVGCGLLLSIMLGSGGAYAQVIRDGTLGPAGPLPGPNYQIRAEDGQQRGGNLFHSFGKFNVNTGESATFSGPNSVENIISRVTGGSSSSIDGTLRSTIPGANLFLLNPAGVLFGPNASLEVSGSFHVSTADYLRLGETDRFYVDPAKPSVLSVAPVTAFGFLSQAPAPLTVQGSFLRVPPGQTLSLIGGDLTLINATLYAPAGRINLAAVGSAGEVVPTAVDLGMQGFGKQGAITIKHPAATRVQIDLSQPFGQVSLGDVDTSGAGGGAIFIRGGQWVSQTGWVFADTYGDQDGRGVDIVLTDAARFESGSLLTASTLGGAGRAGNITLTAHDAVTLTDNSFMLARALAGSTGNAGDITLNVGRLELSNNGEIASNTFGTGRGSTIILNVRDAMTMAGSSYVFASAEPGSTGDGGSITLDVGRLDLSGGSQIVAGTLGPGHGGAIALTAHDAVTIRGTSPRGYLSGVFTSTRADSTGDAGTITLDVGRLELSGGGQIFSGTFGAGRGGDITLTAHDTVSISGINPITTRPSGLVADTEPGSTGDAGNITLTTGSLNLIGGGGVITSTSGVGHGGNITLTARDSVTISGVNPANDHPSGLVAAAFTGSTGDAGNITLTTGSLSLTGGGQIFSSTAGPGHSGDITLTAHDTVTISEINPATNNPSGLLASAYYGSTGDAGNITLTTGSLSLTEGGQIFSGTFGAGRGGDIILTARDAVTITGLAAVATAAQPGSTGDAGSITLNVDRLDLRGAGQILSSTFGAGRGGDITLTTRDTVIISGTDPSGRYPSGLFSGSVRNSTGNAGNITLTTGSLSLTEGGQISSSTVGPGYGGTIGIAARESVMLETGSQISTSSRALATGAAGIIQVQAPLVTITGGLLTSSSTGAGDAGTVELTVDRLVLSNGGRVMTGTGDASAGLGGPGRGGDIRISAGQSVTVAGRDAQGNAAGLFATSQAPASGDAGRIQIQAPVVEVQAGGTITSATEGTGNAGVIGLNVDRLIVNQGGVSTSTEGTGRGGDITVTAKESISLTGRSDSPDAPFGLQASSRIPTSGNAGNIVVTTPAITVSQDSAISSATQGTGNAGTVTLQVDRLTLSEGGQISTATAGSGRGGDIKLTAGNTVNIAGQSGERFAGVVASAAAAGDAGVITIQVPQLTLGAGGRVESATTGAGNAGSVSLQVDRLLLQQGGEISTSTSSQVPTAQSSRALLATSQSVPGRDGAITIQAVPGRGGTITIQAREATLDGGRITSDTAGAGAAGSIELRAERLTLANGGSISTNTTAGRGSGGNIDITTAESITMTGRNESQASGIYARSRAPASGNAGNITLSTDRLTLNEGTTITAESEQTSGGNIVIDARDTRLSKNSTITSSVQGNEQSDGGNVTLTGDKLIVYQGGKLTARANQGRGGRITINENVFLYEAPRAIPDVLDASSQVAGNQGVVTINARDLNLNRTLVPLPATYLDASKLLSNRCTAQQAGGRSSFVVRGRGAVPPGPEGPAPASARECLPAAPEAAEPIQRKSPAVETTETYPHFGY